MNFRHFEALYWIVRLGSFHAAARHLKTSQPAISARVREMEQQLGVTLFDRSERRVRPTAKGHEMLQYAAQIMTIASEIRQRVGTRDVLSGRVRFGLTSIPALTWLPGLIERMARGYPGIVVEATVDSSEVLQAELARGHLDVAVLAGPLDGPKLTAESLGEVPMAWLCSPKLELPLQPLTAADVALWPVITDRKGSPLHEAAMEWFRFEGIEPQRHHGCSSLPTRVQLAVQGIGVALAAPSAASRELARGTLQLVATVRPLPALEYVLAYSEIGLSPAGRIVAEAAKALIGQKPDLQSYYSAADEFRA